MNRSESMDIVDPVPTAPPLPGPRFRGVKNAAYRIIGLPSRPTSPTRKVPKSFDRLAHLAAQNATVSHRTGLEINTLAINERGSHALLGGKEIFKTVKVDRNACIEDRNLRTAIRSTPTQASGKPRQVYFIDIADVAWAKGDCGDFVAAATTSGKIILYDLGHAALQAALLHEHYRQVHKVTFNPHRGNLLLSGSQDGTVRLWDVRDARNHASTVQSKRKFSGQSDGVRDVKWSPTEGVDFAFGTDSGWIQRWDIRNLNVPKIRIPAHQSTCTSLDWHPDGKHLMSAGSDKMLRVWDFSTARRHKPAWELKTPYPISNARWRPSCEIVGGGRMCTQIATAYRDNPTVHIWDLRRSALPFRELIPHQSAPTDMLWHSQDLLWSVGRDGHFIQTDVQYATKTIDQRNLQTIAVSSSSMTAAVQRRYRRMSESRERSLLDDSVDHSFLSPASTLIKSSGVLELDKVLQRKSAIPSQITFHGGMETSFKVMAEHYTAAVSLPVTMDNLQAVFDRCIEGAIMVGQHRLAQTWKIVSFSFLRHIEKRLLAEESKRPKMTLQRMLELSPGTSSVSPTGLRAVSNIGQALTSNTATPLARPTALRDPDESIQLPPSLTTRPVHEGSDVTNIHPSFVKHQSAEHHLQHEALITEVDLDTHQTQVAAHPSQRHHPESVNIEQQTPNDQQHAAVNQSGIMQGQHTEPVDIDMSFRRSKPLDLGHSRPILTKHDSDESFAFMIGSSSSKDPSSLSSIDSPAAMVHERPTRPLLKVNSLSPADPSLDAASFESSNGIAADLAVLEHNIDTVRPPSIHRATQPGTSAKSTKNLLRESSSFLNTTQHQELAQLDECIDQPMLLPNGILAPDQLLSTDKTTRSTRNPLLPLLSTSHVGLKTEEPSSLLAMLHELIMYYASSSDAHTASALLMLAPLMPHQTSDDIQAAKVLSAYSQCHEPAFQQLFESGMDLFRVESIFSTLYDQLMTQKLFFDATKLQKVIFPVFPEACDRSGGFVQLHTQGQQICEVCHCVSSPFGHADSLQIVCLKCNHSSHASCRNESFVDACPTPGCLCACS